MGKRGEVLVAIMNDLRDREIAFNQHWYRIPVRSVKKLLRERWPPKWLAFYQTKEFVDGPHFVNYFSQVIDIREVSRWQLFPNGPKDEKSQRRYYQLILSPLQQLPRPIPSRRWRLIVFIPTTWEKLMNAVEINDLYDDSPLEDRLWAELKRLEIAAERQEFVQVGTRSYALDFAIYCAMGKIDVETDGDTWHASSEKSQLDNIRDNDLKTLGWRTFHFTTRQIKEQAAEYCIPTIVENIKRLGGLEEGGIVPRQINPGGWRQLTLSDVEAQDHLD